MKLKNLLTSVVAGASLLTMVGTASADLPQTDVNIYGASAQLIVWSQNAAAYVTARGCTPMGTTFTNATDSITKANCGANGIKYVRVSAKASYDGPLAIQGNTTNPYRVTTCTNPNQRPFLDETINGCTFGSPSTCTTAALTAANCKPVHVGASDVPVECFTQVSYGSQNFPWTAAAIERDFTQAANKITWTGAAPCQPMAVPFAFFTNNSVMKGGASINNITRDNAELIFDGQAYDWADLVDTDGVAYDAKPIQVCLRHAGSGTHASIDAYITSPLIVSELKSDPWLGASPSGPDFLFNDGSSGMMRCVNGYTSGGNTWSGIGAIGYADADQVLTSYASTRRVSLNGVTPAASTIANGSYNFYGLQQLYGVSATDPLCTFASNPANISNPLWVAKCSMVYQRVNGCEAFPLAYVGATCP